MVLPSKLLAIPEIDIQVAVVADHKAHEAVERRLINSTRRRDGGCARRKPMVLPSPLLAIPEIDIQAAVIADHKAHEAVEHRLAKISANLGLS